MSKFRLQYRELTQTEKDLVFRIKTVAEALDDQLGSAPNSRERALAETKLEECVMWATKAITG